MNSARIDKAHTSTRECVAGVAAVRIAEALSDKNVLAIVSNEYRARDIHDALLGAAPDATVVFFPPSDALPGDAQPPSPANSGERLSALRRLRRWSRQSSGGRIVCITTAEAASEKLPKPATFDAALTRFAPEGKIEPDAFREAVMRIGYFEDDRVDEPAEFAIRGRVIDIFPADASQPVRIEVANGRIARLRAYDPVTQRGVDELPVFELSPAAWPLLQGRSSSLFEHVPDGMIALDPGVAAERARFLALAVDARRGLAGEVAAAAADHMVAERVWDAAIKKRRRLDLKEGAEETLLRFSDTLDPIRAMNKEIGSALERRARVVIAGDRESLLTIKHRLPRKLGGEAKPASSWSKATSGLLNRVRLLEMGVDHSWREPRRLVISTAEALGRLDRRHASSSGVADLMLELGDICVGDVVIHEDHGIAVIAGLQRLPSTGTSTQSAADGESEAIELEYAGGARRLVPVEEADRIWKYGADRSAVKLDTLNGATWRKRRLLIDKALQDTAKDMMRLAAEAQSRRSVTIDPDPVAYRAFSAGFPFTETPDQARAIEAVRDDLASGKPMDRLVIGDVGYGKTEVALRAAALTALAGFQVAIAAPTTVLVRQHFETFRRRFEGAGVEVASLSRLSNAAEKKRVKAGLADGSISVVIGTGAVAADGVDYKRLGLVVIDEEQRFGAADKARLRALAEQGHALTLTATPIPRTLQTALLGLKQMSVIATPPARRQPIRTLAGEFDETQIKTALLREQDRGGQSFVVVPRIDDLPRMKERLERLTPDLSLLEAHGDMPPGKIDEAMIQFAAGDADILLATNIIEAGLDVPRANTMIVWRADRFGLAQLHQLRGRVGRGNRRGHILLTTEPGGSLTDATRKRLRTLESLDRLGAGFAISARDLDIRGAGDLVGDEQSGHMKLIGIDLYQNLLERAVREVQGEPVERWTPVINLGLGGRFPPTWIPEADTRLSLYLRLARITTRNALASFEEELTDRFGSPPEEALVLLRIARLGALAREADVARIDGGPNALAFTPRTSETMLRGTRAGLIEKKGRLLANEAIDSAVMRLERAEILLTDFMRDTAPAAQGAREAGTLREKSRKRAAG